MAEQPQLGPEPEAVHGGEPGSKPEAEPGSVVAAAFGGIGPDQIEQDLIAREARAAIPRRIGRGISHIFEKVTGGVKLGAERASHLTNAVVSKAANIKIFGQNLKTNTIDYALHHKKEIVTGAVTGAVAGGLGKAAVRGVLTGTGGFLVAAGAGAGGGALAGGVKEYLKQREGIQINEAEKALIISGLKNEFRRIRGADKKKIRDAAVRGAIVGAIGGLVGAEITDFVANNEWVQEQIAKIRVLEIRLPEVKIPQFEGTAPSVPGGFAPDFPALETTPFPTAEVTPVPAAPTLEPIATPGPVAAPTATVEATAVAPTAVPTAEATPTPTVTPIPTETPTPVPTGTPTPEASPGPPPAVQPPAAPELAPAPPASELAAAPPVVAPEASPATPPTSPVTAEPASVPPGGGLAVAQPEVPAPPAELATLPEQIPLPAGSNPWEVTDRYLHDILGRDPTNAEILQVTKEVCRQSNISVPNWEITGEIDHRKLPVNYKLIFNDPVKKLIAGMKG